MRVSSNTHYIGSTYNLQYKQYQLNRIDEQLSTLRRVVRPSDDPVASAQIVSYSQSLSFNTQMTENNKAVDSKLGILEGSLDQATKLLQDFKQLAVQAGNTALSDENRRAIQLQFQEGVKSLMALANSSDGQGNYIFSGTKTGTAPFQFAMTPSISISYQGDWQRQDVQVSSSRELSVTEPGGLVFGSTSTVPVPANPNAFSAGNELFQAIKRFDDILTAGPSALTPPDDYTTSLNAVLGGLDKGLQQVTTAMASIGARRAEATHLSDTNEGLKIQYTGAIGALQDLDIPQAVSDFKMAMLALDTTQKAYSMVSDLTLFKYI